MMLPELLEAGHRRGLKDCSATHDDLTGSFFDSGWEDGYEEGQARGRVYGALIVAVLVGLSWWWRRT